MSEPDDLELIRRLRHRDRAVREPAFAALFERHSRRAYDLAWRVLGDADLAADVVQEAFLSVYRKGARFEERAQFTSWLYRIVLNRSIDLRRRERRFRDSAGSRSAARSAPSRGDRRSQGSPTDEAERDPLEAAAAHDPAPEEASLREERAEAVRSAIGRLSPKLAEVVALRYPQGMSYEEIGAVLGVPPGTVKSRLNRAHAALREILGPVLDAEPTRGGDPSSGDDPETVP
jgi:RNA polymerase sigma-70 factor (ECF subfamily)